MGGLNIVPSILVGPARLALAAQGIDPSMISDSGDVDPQALIAMAFDNIEIRTTLTPPVNINLKQKGTGGGSALVNQLKPMLTFSGRAGKIVFAPAGEPGAVMNLTPQATEAGIGIGLGLLGLLIIGGVLLS